jgi:uncharacterized protein YbjT (DUF2867 family)
VPFTIVQSTQFMELLARVADAGSEGDVARVPDTRVQPAAAIEVAGFVAAVATDPPVHGTIEIAGPEPYSFADAIARVLNDHGRVVADPDARYFGSPVQGNVLPGPQAHLASLRLAEWLSRRGERAAAA